MREIPAGFQAHLNGQATTLSYCWRLTRTDGMVLGFTDHDERLSFAGTDFEAATGLAAGEAEAMLGLAAGTQEVEGALSSLAIEEADIRAGRYDGARIEIFVANWQDAAASHVLMDVADLGEVKRGETGFVAELRGIASRLDRRRGRLYRRRCDAVLGDGRCRIDLTRPEFFVEATLVREADGALIVSGAFGEDIARFVNGHVVFKTGAASGLSADIASIGREGAADEHRIVPVEAIAAEPAPGDGLRVVAGCDKSYATCRSRFENGLNFRGFPHLPGTDAAFGIAKKDGVHDGSPVVS